MATERFPVIILVLFFFQYCANIKQPQGGPVDVEPPQLQYTAPPKNTVNFRDNAISFTFHERIIGNNPEQNILISPAPEDSYKSIIRKNKLIITFEGPLRENTTYTIFLKDAVKDITEGNLVKNEIYTFSTGSYIDSLFIGGIIKNLETDQPLKDVFVGLYPASEGFLPLEEKPMYFSITGASGNFLLPNLKEGNYDLYAFPDINRNFLYNPESEQIGFKKNLELNQSIRDLKIGLGKFDETPPAIASQRADSLIHVIRLSEGLTQTDVKRFDKTALPHALTDPKEITIYRPENYRDTLHVNLTAVDSSGNILNDTVKVYFGSSGIFFSPETALINQVNPENRQVNPAIDSISIHFSAPVIKSNIKLIGYQGIKKNQVNYNWNVYNNILYLKIQGATPDTIGLIIPENTFTDIFGRKNQSDSLIFSKKPVESTGLISGNVTTSSKNYVLELLNERYEVVARRINPGEFTFNYLNPGSYFIRTFIDRNNNGKWDRGNPRTNEEPEPLIFYPEPIKLRANWEITGVKVTVD